LARVKQKEISVMDSNNFDKLSRSLAGTSSRRQALKLMGGGLIGGFAAAAGLKGAAAQVEGVTGSSVIPVSFANELGEFVGNFALENFVIENGEILGVGQLTGTVTGALDSGIVGGAVSQLLELPVQRQQSSGSCDILTLVLGPLDLNLLGLNVFLDTVVLEITAEPGPGNLLGNLLCQIAGLLNPGGGGGLLRRLTDLLNQLLGSLGV
jgi:hypothetical protein